MKSEEELQLLEKMLVEPQSKQVASEEEKSSSMLSNGNVEPEIKCNLQFNFKNDELIFQASNNKLQLETNLDDEIKELRKLMEIIHKP